MYINLNQDVLSGSGNKDWHKRIKSKVLLFIYLVFNEGLKVALYTNRLKSPAVYTIYGVFTAVLTFCIHRAWRALKVGSGFLYW